MLHVTNGDSVVATLEQTGIGGATLSWRDVLHEGPLVDGSRSELLDARASFLAGAGWGDAAGIRGDLERRDRALVEALGRGDEVVLWFEHDLHDQLELVDVLALVGGRVDQVTLIEVDRFEGRERFWGLGELNADELATLWPLRRAVTAEDVAEARAVWDALRRGELTAVDDLRRGLVARPFLAAALRRLLQELPWTTDGLSLTERLILQTAEPVALRPVELFVALQHAEAAPYSGDAWVWARMYELGSGEHRLLHALGGGELPEPPPGGDARHWVATPLAPTDEGLAVLHGEADALELRGVDRWVGGAHVTASAPWRWGDAADRVVAP